VEHSVSQRHILRAIRYVPLLYLYYAIVLLPVNINQPELTNLCSLIGGEQVIFDWPLKGV